MKKTPLLYVDDEPINLKLFKLNFDKIFELHVAESGMEALKIIEENDISIIISDYKMPEMNGVEFIGEAKKRKDEFICFLLSAYKESELRSFTIESKNIDGYISKPWKRDDVLNLINKSLEVSS
ncbi:MAG: response regulator [Salinivirgaceae bacterium]|nr:response regulator [Salinivirgaceae bacterium]